MERDLYYYRARYYDPNTGRFASEDPIGFSAGDVNIYRYVFNNPLNFNDPSGEIPTVVVGAIGGGVIGGGIGAVRGFRENGVRGAFTGFVTGGAEGARTLARG